MPIPPRATGAAHAQTLLAQSEADGAPLPRFVQAEFHAYIA
jgi:hypothetical protein